MPETPADNDAVPVIDESGFLKQGRESGSVKRQYTGSAGRSRPARSGCLRRGGVERALRRAGKGSVLGGNLACGKLYPSALRLHLSAGRETKGARLPIGHAPIPDAFGYDT